MARILHFADLHLERRFGGASMTRGEAERRRGELRDALSRIVDRAVELDVDAVTVAGDLFEGEHATADTGAFLVRQFMRLWPRPVLIAPGNHDPLVAGSLWDRARWPENVTVFGSRAWGAKRLSGDVTVWGIGHDGPELRRNVLGELQALGAGISLALFHGSDVSTGGARRSVRAPFQPEDVARSGAAFALLGHEHSWVRTEHYVNPGSPEPLAFFTEGPHFAALAEVREGALDVRPLLVSEVRYRTETVEVGRKGSVRSLPDAIREVARGGVANEILRIVLRGTCPPSWPAIARATASSLARPLRYVEVVHETDAQDVGLPWPLASGAAAAASR